MYESDLHRVAWSAWWAHAKCLSHRRLWSPATKGIPTILGFRSEESSTSSRGYLLGGDALRWTSLSWL